MVYFLNPVSEKLSLFGSISRTCVKTGHACNPSTFGGRGGWITWGQELRTSLVNMVNPCLYRKYKSYLGMVVHTCSSSTREAEAGLSLECRRQRLQWAEITPLHSSLAPGDGARFCLKKKIIWELNWSFCCSMGMKSGSGSRKPTGLLQQFRWGMTVT